MKWVDLPPVWLLGFIGLAWLLAQAFPFLRIEWSGQKTVAAILIGSGLVLMAMAAFEMMRARTTIIPRHVPSTLVNSGVFRLSRNPIYLGDALVLTGAVLWFGSVLGLLLVPAFIWLIDRRFIAGEEATLRAQFGAEFGAWAKNTRRWL